MIEKAEKLALHNGTGLKEKFNYWKYNQRFGKVSVKRGTTELSGKNKRTHIYELFYFIPTQHHSTSSPGRKDSSEEESINLPVKIVNKNV